MRRSLAVLLTVALSPWVAAGADEGNVDRRQIRESVERLSAAQKQLTQEIESLRKLVGVVSAIEEVALLPAVGGMGERVRLRTEDGIRLFQEEEYERAKESLQRAWERMPNNYITNFNLGMAYYKLGNRPLAKKMFKAALDNKQDFPGSAQARNFLEPGRSRAVAADDDSLTKEEEALMTVMINLKKEGDSYMKSQSLSYPEQMQAAVSTFDKLVEKGGNHKALVRKFFVGIGEAYAAFELYDKAMDAFGHYEKAMTGKVFPDGYHTRVLRVEDQQREQAKALKAYVANRPEKDIKRKLNRDLEELEIFAAQLDEFVETTHVSDSDFNKWCARLKEYRWGNRKDRHVIVVDRFQELLYSSLAGTLPLVRYQDVEGRKFLRDITLLADRLGLKEVEFFPVDLKVRNKDAPYVVMYTYVPRHKAFIIVRLPREDLI